MEICCRCRSRMPTCQHNNKNSVPAKHVTMTLIHFKRLILTHCASLYPKKSILRWIVKDSALKVLKPSLRAPISLQTLGSESPGTCQKGGHKPGRLVPRLMHGVARCQRRYSTPSTVRQHLHQQLHCRAMHALVDPYSKGRHTDAQRPPWCSHASPHLA